MALVLVQLVDRTHPDPVKDQRGCYKRGDIIVIYEDWQHDGDTVKNPIRPGVCLVRVTGVTKAQLEAFIAPETTGERRLVTRRRAYRLDFSLMSPALRNAIETGSRFYTVSWTQVRNFVRNKTTGVSA